jgi:hypothetical protein
LCWTLSSAAVQSTNTTGKTGTQVGKLDVNFICLTIFANELCFLQF